MSNINDMVTKVNRFGVVRGNNYRVTFSGIVGNADSVIGTPSGSEYSSRMSLSCESVSLPGRSLSTNEFKTIGVAREIPYERLFSGDVSMTFLFGRDMLERKIFETWMDFITNPINNRFSYYNEYIAEASIVLYDESDNPVYKVRIDEIYPKEISPVELSNDSSEISKQTINFAFRSYTPINTAVGGSESIIPEGLNNVSGALDAALANIGVGQGIYSAGRDFLGDIMRSVETVEKYADDGAVVDRNFIKNHRIGSLYGIQI